MEKIWLKSYQAGVPAEINPDEYSSLVDIFLQSCNKFKDKLAFSHLGTNLSYDQLKMKCRDFAAYCQKGLKLAKGSRVAIMLPNSLQYPVAMFGALQAGLTVVNVNPLYTPRELQHQLKDSGASAIVILENFVNVLQQVLPETEIKHIIVSKLGDLFHFPKSFYVNFVLKYIKKMIPHWTIPQAIHFKTTLMEGKKLDFDPVFVQGSDIAFLQYTGGTTGIAKGAELSHRNMVANLQQASAWVRPMMHEGSEIIITALPLYHIFSLTANCLTFMKFGGMSILITNPRDIPRFVSQIAKFPFTVITGVNTLFNALLNNKKFSQLNFSNLKLALGGGMAVQKIVAERWQKVTGKIITEAYGLTETCPASTINPLSLTTFNDSIGLPISSTDVKLIDDENNEVPLGKEGELCIKGPQVMRGYWNNPEETQKVFTADGWLKTGDICFMDDKGYLHLVDRKKDMILVSGFNVYPNEIENVIASHPGVLEVAVVGVPDEHSMEVPKAFIVKKDPSLTAEDILAYCHSQLTGYKIPKYIEFRTDLPKSNVGKILRRELRNEAKNKNPTK